MYKRKEHAMKWNEYEMVAGRSLPNEAHAAHLTGRFIQEMGASSLGKTGPIFVTDTFVKNISEIYGMFSHGDDEYPAMGITIQGAPVFVECNRFPNCAVVRRRCTDEVKREHPAVGALWQRKLSEYDGKCRTSTVHIHPMNLPGLSGTDIANFDSLRLNPDDPSTFEGTHPYPVILVNLAGGGNLELIGFWVSGGTANRVSVEPVSDDSEVIKKAWKRARKMPYFSREGYIVRRINQRVGKDWEVELGVHPRTGAKAIKATRNDGEKVLVRFNSETPLGLSLGGAAQGRFCFEDYFDWTRLFDDLARERGNNDGADTSRIQCSSAGGQESVPDGETVEISSETVVKDPDKEGKTEIGSTC